MIKTDTEKRAFLRFKYEKPVQCKNTSPDVDKNSILSFVKGMSKNLSASGAYFLTNAKKALEISDLLLIDIDYETNKICRELIESRVILVSNKLLGRVVRLENNDDGSLGVGIAFVTTFDNLS